MLHRRVLGALVLSGLPTLLSCGGDGTGLDGRDVVTSVSISPAQLTLDPGETASLNAVLRNHLGAVIAGSVSWSTSAPTVATVSATGLVTGVAEGAAVLTASSSGLRATAAVTVRDPDPPQAPASLTAVPVSRSAVDLSWTDRSDNEDEFRIERVVAGQAGDFAQVGAVGPDVTAYRDTGLSPGTAYDYRVLACNKNGCTGGAVAARAATLSSLTVETDELPTGAVGDDYGVTVQAVGGDGTYAWTVHEGELPSGLTLSAEGRVRGIPEAEGRWEFTLEVVSGDEQTETAEFAIAVQPGPLRIRTTSLPDGRAGLPYDQGIRAYGGEGAYTYSVADGTLPGGLALDPVTGSLKGSPDTPGTHPFTIGVADEAGATALAPLTVIVCEPVLTLAPGQTTSVPFPHYCGVVVGPDQADYRIGLMPRRITNGAASLPGGLSLDVVGGTPGSAFRSTGMGPEDAIDAETLRLMRATERLHFRLREEELAARPNVALERPSVLGPPLARANLGSRAPPPPDRTFWVRDPALGRRIEITATLRSLGEHVVFYEDDGGVGEGNRATQEQIDAVVDYYDAFGQPVIDAVFGGLGPAGTTTNFLDDQGNVLVLPTDDLDQNGLLIVLQIRRALMPEGAAAYVSSCDRSPTQETYNGGPFTCAGSNRAEITYVTPPTSNFYLGSVVHEAKHVSSHGYAFFGGRGFNPSWIEEGTAEIAKEKSSRDAAGFGDGIELGPSEVYPGGSTTAATYGMALVHSRARRFLKASPVSGLIANPNPNPNNSTYYGASFLFHRFLADAYAGGDEDGFFHSLNTGGAGTERLEQVTGRLLSDLFAEFMAAIAVEGAPDARSQAANRFVSYDFAAIATLFSGGPWPYSQASRVLSPAHFTSPTFFDVSHAGGAPLRLDARAADGLDLSALHDVVMVVTRLR